MPLHRLAIFALGCILIGIVGAELQPSAQQVGGIIPPASVTAAGGVASTANLQVASLGLNTPASATASTITATAPFLIFPSTDTTTAVNFTKADGTTAVLTLDTTNSKLILPASGTITPASGTMNLGSTSLTVGTTGILTGHTAGSFFDSIVFTTATHLDGGYVFGWNNAVGASPTPAAPGTLDVAFARNTAGVIEVNNGTAGTIRDMLVRHQLGGGTAPTIGSACGTSGIAPVSDEVGRVVIGSAPTTSCVVTFGSAYTNAPVCQADNETTLGRVIQAQETTTNVKFIQYLSSTGVATVYTQSDNIGYHCRGF